MLTSLTLCSILFCTSCSEDENAVVVYPTPLRTIITGMNYADSVLVVGHKSPDCDAVFSAITYANLLQRMGINAKAKVAGKVL